MSLNREAIEKLIPHREPFLLLDAITAIDTDKLTATFTPQASAPLFAQIYPGHYPQQPVTPGVILCEIIFQAGAVLMAHRLQEAEAAGTPIVGVPVITRIRDAKFKRMVKPGEELTINVEFEDQVSNAYYLKGGIDCAGLTAVRIAFTCALTSMQ
jgi:3-hydroxyacyl-[acyl-carrier-protein] dehydratase